MEIIMPKPLLEQLKGDINYLLFQDPCCSVDEMKKVNEVFDKLQNVKIIIT